MYSSDGDDSRGWLGDRTISSESRDKRLYRTPPQCIEAVRAAGSEGGAVMVALPGGLRVKQHSAGPGKAPAVGSPRGVICGFSQRSRQRMIERLMSLDWSAGACYFVGLTYHESYGDDWQGWKQHLKRFEARLSYRYGDLLRGILWRMEIVPRKSGAHVGELAPHFHLCLFWRCADGPHMPTFRQWLAGAWNEIAEPGNAKHRQVATSAVKARNTGGAEMNRLLAYLSKYIGKVQTYQRLDEATGELLGTGRVWGVAGEMPAVLIGAYQMDANTWVQFTARVSEYGASVKSWYLSAVSPLWRGFSIMGDGLLLLDELLRDLEGVRLLDPAGGVA